MVKTGEGGTLPETRAEPISCGPGGGQVGCYQFSGTGQFSPPVDIVVVGTSLFTSYWANPSSTLVVLYISSGVTWSNRLMTP